ncbi:hypothetical protein CDCA_CDCA08G2306 [Cyanidium caldarium]|uniref:poly(A)-specific ribonuclease n=1 Tax=Cyanidium caldarium TaxID=2771 RepID=A0AAV9IW00_CYACA|nr:hypothetical protein CDCA_CDCA08G2306 [Cyanidium caldarium]
MATAGAVTWLSGGSGGGGGDGVAATGAPAGGPLGAPASASAAGRRERARMPLRIREVYAENLEDEIRNLSNLVAGGKYTVLAMDTEFPGVVARPLGTFANGADFMYHCMRCNVDLLNVIQIGICVADADGRLPGMEDAAADVWQFNFAFSVERDLCAQESIALLTEAGIDFEAHARHGIDPLRFGELLMTSGIVLNEQVTWVTFHSGYDFGYLIKICTADALPEDEREFHELLQLFFPRVYDVKVLMERLELRGGLNRLAETLQVRRYGPIHQAGSDALLTLDVFERLGEAYAHALDLGQCMNQVHGLGRWPAETSADDSTPSALRLNHDTEGGKREE